MSSARKSEQANERAHTSQRVVEEPLKAREDKMKVRRLADFDQIAHKEVRRVVLLFLLLLLLLLLLSRSTRNEVEHHGKHLQRDVDEALARVIRKHDIVVSGTTQRNATAASTKSNRHRASERASGDKRNAPSDR